MPPPPAHYGKRDTEHGREDHDKLTRFVSGRYAKLVGGQALAPLSDRDLLRRHLEERDEAAFTALLERHGPMVLGVCRRVLADEADVEDCFQATFLVLLRKAASIRKCAAVGSWLHGVAHRLASNARAARLRRRQCESQAAAAPACRRWGGRQAWRTCARFWTRSCGGCRRSTGRRWCCVTFRGRRATRRPASSA